MSDFVYKGDDFDDKVKKQVEFYFSDSNLQTDKFLWKIYEANDGWVELKTILTFSRMRQYRPEEKVVQALEGSEKLLLSQSKDMVRRKEPLKELNELKNIRKRNSVHVEGFPKDLSQDDLENWFNSKIVHSLPNEKHISSLRRIKSKAKKVFFGVIDVEFKSHEDADYFLNKMEVIYPQGIVDKSDESIDKKSVLKKMSLLTFQEMKENGKRFGVNDVTKRRNSFNENSKNKKNKKNLNGKGSNVEDLKDKVDTTQSVNEDALDDSDGQKVDLSKKAEESTSENRLDEKKKKDGAENTPQDAVE